MTLPDQQSINSSKFNFSHHSVSSYLKFEVASRKMNLYKILAAVAVALALVGSSMAVKDGAKEHPSGKLIKKPLIKVHVIKPFVKKAPTTA